MKNRKVIIIIGIAISGIFAILFALNQIDYHYDQKQLEQWRDIRESVLDEIKEKKLNQTTETASIIKEEQKKFYSHSF
ncbi:MAG: hypothetical protein COY74_10215 [Nitrosopumilales archaeon CG_4_10_14_0_8_um_filter_34_8]|nr:MAG: hypothetical protein COY74_10215 [Nitrosopumilales archaeon CG_4_10_14_0_8_um_filter_34_8]